MKYHAAGEPRIVPQVGDLANQLLAGLVGRMRLAGEDDLDRPLRIVDHRRQSIQIAHDQVGPLVGGKSSGEADRQNVRVEQVAGDLHRLVAFAAAAALAAHAPADERQQAGFSGRSAFPTIRPDRAGGFPARLPGSPIRCSHSAGNCGRKAAASARPASWERARRW